MRKETKGKGNCKNGGPKNAKAKTRREFLTKKRSGEKRPAKKWLKNADGKTGMKKRKEKEKERKKKRKRKERKKERKGKRKEKGRKD